MLVESYPDIDFMNPYTESMSNDVSTSNAEPAEIDTLAGAATQAGCCSNHTIPSHSPSISSKGIFKDKGRNRIIRVCLTCHVLKKKCDRAYPVCGQCSALQSSIGPFKDKFPVKCEWDPRVYGPDGTPVAQQSSQKKKKRKISKGGRSSSGAPMGCLTSPLLRSPVQCRIASNDSELSHTTWESGTNESRSSLDESSGGGPTNTTAAEAGPATQPKESVPIRANAFITIMLTWSNLLHTLPGNLPSTEQLYGLHGLWQYYASVTEHSASSLSFVIETPDQREALHNTFYALSAWTTACYASDDGLSDLADQLFATTVRVGRRVFDSMLLYDENIADDFTVSTLHLRRSLAEPRVSAVTKDIFTRLLLDLEMHYLNPPKNLDLPQLIIKMMVGFSLGRHPATILEKWSEVKAAYSAAPLNDIYTARMINAAAMVAAQTGARSLEITEEAYPSLLVGGPALAQALSASSDEKLFIIAGIVSDIEWVRGATAAAFAGYPYASHLDAAVAACTAPLRMAVGGSTPELKEWVAGLVRVLATPQFSCHSFNTPFPFALAAALVILDMADNTALAPVLAQVGCMPVVGMETLNANGKAVRDFCEYLLSKKNDARTATEPNSCDAP